jgi:hypothetical protein
MSVDKILKAALENFDALKPGAYYGTASGLSLGAGLIYDNIPVASYNESDKQFEIRDSLALVITHECDVANDRAFNDHVLVCPILPMDAYAGGYIDQHGFDSTYNLTKEIAKNNVHRVFYLPPPPNTLGDLRGFVPGGLIYLNMITATNVSFFKVAGQALCALSTYALERFDWKLANHLLRPKAEPLPRLG